MAKVHRAHLRADIKRQLRREVGYGCPFPGCRKPFLTYHHFDPPWGVGRRHDPNGMIAICLEHHAQADRGVYSIQDLRALKQGIHSADGVKGHFPWTKREFLVRVGGCYVGRSGAQATIVLNSSQGAVVQLRRNQEGLLALSFCLAAPDGESEVVMEDNVLLGDPAEIHDLVADTGATQLRIWWAKKSVGLQLKFARVSHQELELMLERDRARGMKAWTKCRNAGGFEIDCDGDDVVSSTVLAWATKNCLDDEGRIPLVDIDQARVCLPGRPPLVIRDGVSPVLRFSAAIECGVGFALDGGVGGFSI